MKKDNENTEAAIIKDLQKQIAYLERKNARLHDQQVRQEKINDINRRLLKKRNSELKHALVLAEQANRSKTDFLANISHEIRTPLNIVLGVGEILADTGLDSFQKGQLSNLQKFGNQLLDILNNVLEFSRIDSGEITLQTASFSVKSLLSDIETMIGPLAFAKGLDFSIHCELETGEYRKGDVAKIRQILINILNNAVKFTNDGQVKLAVQSVLSDSSVEEIAFHISDNGPGIPEDKYDLIFDRFSQADSSLSSGNTGVGLGLAICKKLVDLLNGKVRVESQKGEGTTFSVYLPIEFSESEKSSIGHVSENYQVLSLPSMRILVADDVVENAHMVRHFLQDFEVELEYAANGNEALSLLESSRFDLILMDIRMPEMDGVTAVKKIREDNNHPHNSFPVIAITAHAFEEQVNEYLKDGFDEILSKPFSKKDLIRTLYRFAPVGGMHSCSGNPLFSLCEETEIEDIEVSESIRPLIGDVIERLQCDLVDITESISANDTVKTSDLCHSARGLSGMYKMKQFSKLIENISSSVKNGKVELARDIIIHSEKHLKELQHRYQ